MPKSLQEQAAEACIAIATMKPDGKPIRAEVFVAANVGEALIAHNQRWKVDDLDSGGSLHWCSERGRRDCAFLKRSDAEAYARYKNRQAGAPPLPRSHVYDWSSFMAAPAGGGGSLYTGNDKRNAFVRLLALWIRSAQPGMPYNAPSADLRNAANDLVASGK